MNRMANEAEAEWGDRPLAASQRGGDVQRRYELEIAQQDSASCPECWIDWQVIDAAGQGDQPDAQTVL
ncbi:hypothetical protein MJK72_13770 [Klebsiella pneumoniae]|nr:hypothetical protein MJK72_13770 [Klebsiella pneumoniae]